MCDYDYSYTEISARDVKTKKPHECDSCQKTFPAGTKMHYAVGLSEGDFCATYCCPACDFARQQKDHTELHLCWGWNWYSADESGYEHGAETWQYIDDCIKRGETPTVEGVKAVIAALQTAEEE
jgi:hypothetical protein